jgi:GT2 family glycosyltransferase
MVNVTVVILNWNGRNWLEQFLPSVRSTTYTECDILIIDNGSTDGSVEFIQTHFPDFRIVSLDRNYGFAQGNNLGVAHVNTPYYVLLNSDVEVTPGWLEPLVELMETDSRIAAVQPDVLSWAEKDRFEYAGASGGFIDRFGYPFCRGRLFDQTEKDEGQYPDSREIFWATGACSLIRKSVSDRIGLFEPAFFAHMEEIDFCWRARNYDYRILVQPESKVYHVGGGTLDKANPRKTFLNVHNSLAMMLKNLPVSQYYRIFMRLVLDGVWAVRSLLQGDFKTIWAILKAHLQLYANVGYWFHRRKKAYPTANQKKPGGPGYYPRSIVWQFFIRGRKAFSQLPE